MGLTYQALVIRLLCTVVIVWSNLKVQINDGNGQWCSSVGNILKLTTDIHHHRILNT
jgi:hypothetical protein